MKSCNQIFLVLFFTLIVSFNLQAQKQVIDTLSEDVNFDNIFAKKLYSDSLSTSFLICIKNQVKEHKHLAHTESVYVESGEAIMTLAKDTFKIKKGDFIVIPLNTYHSVTKVLSSEPLKVLSIQSPEFLGDDRVFKN